MKIGTARELIGKKAHLVPIVGPDDLVVSAGSVLESAEVVAAVLERLESFRMGSENLYDTLDRLVPWRHK